MGATITPKSQPKHPHSYRKHKKLSESLLRSQRIPKNILGSKQNPTELIHSSTCTFGKAQEQDIDLSKVSKKYKTCNDLVKANKSVSS